MSLGSFDTLYLYSCVSIIEYSSIIIHPYKSFVSQYLHTLHTLHPSLVALDTLIVVLIRNSRSMTDMKTALCVSVGTTLCAVSKFKHVYLLIDVF